MGILAHAKGQTVTVPDTAEAYYLDKGWTRAGAEETAPAVPGPATPDESWKNGDLEAYAAEHRIDLEGATKKADLLAAIAAAKPLPEADPDGNPVTPSTPTGTEDQPSE